MNEIIGNHVKIEMKNILLLTNLLTRLVLNDGQNVLLVCDIDDTLIKPTVTLGSSSWYKFLLQTEHECDYNSMINKMDLIYPLLDFCGVEKETDDFVSTIYRLSKLNSGSLKYICLTARNIRYHSQTLIHFESAKYDNVLIRPNMLDVGEYIDPFPLCRYIDNICFTSGNKKGDVLTNILDKYYKKEKTFDIIIYIDDSINDINSVYENITKNGGHKLYKNTDTYCIHYTNINESVNKYSYADYEIDRKKTEDAYKFRKYINSKSK
jgi:hypothetical protein